MGDWQQEAYLVNFYGHYANQQQPMPITEWPHWIEQGVAVLSHLTAVEHDEQMKQARKQSGQNQYYGS